MSLLSDVIEKQSNSLAFDAVQDLVFPGGPPGSSVWWEHRGREGFGLTFRTALKIELWCSAQNFTQENIKRKAVISISLCYRGSRFWSLWLSQIALECVVAVLFAVLAHLVSVLFTVGQWLGFLF